MAAAARRDGVRVVDAEAATHQVINEVDVGAPQIAQTGRIDQQADAVNRHNGVEVLGVFLDGHAVLQAGATAAAHEHAQGVILKLACGEDFLDLADRTGGDAQGR